MIPYILHVTVILTICFLFYKLFLQKATFYGLNRWTLLSCLLFSFVLPLLPAPRGWAWNSAAAADPVAPADPVAATPAVSNRSAFSNLSIDPMPPATTAAPTVGLSPKLKPKKTAAHLLGAATTKLHAARPAPDDAALRPATTAIPRATSSALSHPLQPLLLKGLQLLSYVYGLGLLVFGLKFVLQIFLLCCRSLTRPIIRDGRYRIVQTGGDRGPCTFGNTIFINPSLYDPETFQQILVHEKIHVRGGHTLDILLAELAVVIQWFNPFVWLYRREVESNLEFLTDRSVLEHPDIERLDYQLSLLRVSAPHLPFSITNNYNQSLLKRRIVMMNSQHSARFTIWKYFVLLPILTVLVCVLNKPAALGQTAAAKTGQAASATSVQVRATVADTAIRPVKATANPSSATRMTDTIVEQTIATVNNTVTIQTTTAVDPVISIDGYATEPAVATAITASPNVQSNAVAMTISDTAVPHFFENVDLRQGSWFLTVDSDCMDFILRAQDGENSWESSFTVKKSEISPYPARGTVEFKLVREAGTITFKGQFDGGQGFGRFQFQPDQAYFDAIGKMGVEDAGEGREHVFFQMNIKKDYISMLNRIGYTPIEPREVISLAVHKIDEPFLKYWKSSGIEGTDQIRNLISLKIQHIEPSYIEELKSAGYTQLDVRQVITLNRQHIDGNYIRTMNAGTANPISPEELISYKLMHIDSGYLIALKKVGYDHLDRSEIRQLYSAHVTADFIKGFQDAGFSNIPPHTLVYLKLRNASPDDAKTFRSLGYSDVDLTRLPMLKDRGITAEFINAFHKIGYDNIPVNLLYSLKMNGVDADYVAKMKEKGFNSTDLNKYIRLKRDFN
jgi:BlaR1 peptidase M56